MELGIAGIGAGEVIGGGGSSTVFGATRVAYGDRVAVKVLKTTLADDVSRRHFEREVLALRELADCPGIVAVLESGVTDRGEPYLVLPLFDRSAQSELERSGPMPWLRATRIVADAARALHQGHDRGIYHRDLKPANLLLTARDDVFITDFGIAKLTDHSMSVTGFVGLTPAYAPPEILEGQSASVQSDIYSIAATLVALVNGHAPFTTTEQETPIAIMRRIVEQGPPEFEPEVPAELRAAVAGAVARDPAERYPTSLELADALDGVLSAHQAARPTSPAAPGLSTARPETSVVELAGGPDSGPGGHSEVAGFRAEPASPPTGPAAPPPPRPAPPPAPPQPPSPPGPPVQPSVPPQPPHPSSAQVPVQPVAATADGPSRGRLATIGAAVAALIALIAGVVYVTSRGDDPEVVVADPSPVATEAPTPRPTEAPSAIPTEVPTTVPTPPPPATPAPSALTGPVTRLAADGSTPGFAAALAGAAHGEVIELGPGDFEIADTVVIAEGVIIRGAGPGNTRIVVTGDTQAISIVGENVSFSDLTVTTTFEPTDADERFALIQIASAQSAVIDRVEVTGGASTGLGVFGTSTATVTNSTFADNASSGVRVADASSVDLVNNRAVANGHSGFLFTGDSGGQALGNQATDNLEAGFGFRDRAAPAIIANRAEANALSGYVMSDSSAPALSANLARDNDQSGFVWFQVSSGEATGNLAVANEFAGYSIESQADPELVANRARDNLNHGFQWIGSATGTATNNVATGNQTAGFATFDSAAPILVDNHAAANPEGDFALAAGNPTNTDERVIAVSADRGDESGLAAAVARAEPGSLLVLAPGDHRIETAVALDTDLVIVGSGPDATTITVTGDTNALTVRGSTVRLFDLSVRSTFEPGAGGNTFGAIELGDADDAMVVDIAVIETRGAAVTAFQGSSGIVAHSRVADVSSAFESRNTSELVIVANDVSAGSIRWFEGSGGVAAANTVSDSPEQGYVIAERAHPALIANRVVGSRLSGFLVADDATPTLVANTSEDNQEAGFAWHHDSSGSAHHNRAESNLLAGFSAEGSSTPVLSANRSVGNDGGTFRQDPSAEPTLSANAFGQ